jgi:hypothetical protein
MTALGRQESFANDSFMAMNMVVLDDEHGFSFGHKKALHLHVRLSWVMCNLGLNIQIALVPRVVRTILYFKIFLPEITHLKPV